MYEKILAAVDESEVADRVVAAASDLATLSHGEVLCSTCTSASRQSSA